MQNEGCVDLNMFNKCMLLMKTSFFRTALTRELSRYKVKGYNGLKVLFEEDFTNMTG